MNVFVDTAAWIALANADDALHTRADQVMNDLLTQKSKLVTTEFVLLEVADALSAPNLRSNTIQFINRLRQAPILRIIPVSEALLIDGWTLYGQLMVNGWIKAGG